MSENLHLVSDLALIFISAGIITLIFKALKQPLILGYIVAGFLIGPNFVLFPNITEPESVEQWSEIGIIFLLFALGLEFSFKKLIKVGSSALITAGTIFAGMFVTGFALGSLMGWSNIECIFLGGMLSMSSTTIIIKAFDDLGLKGKPFTGVVFGTLVVEDLLAVVLMVLLSTMAVSRSFAGGEMLMALAKLLFFLILWFVVGMFLIPTLLKKGRQIMNREMTVILSTGLCFGMVILANLAGFSSALGAFVMGSLLAETLDGERILDNIQSIKDLFGAVFFVSVGMMVDPAIIVQYWKPVLALILAVVICIPFFASLGILFAGKGLHCALRGGLSMAQIGEFAFIIAGLGRSLGVMADHVYPMVVAVSVITTFTTPYFIKLAEPLYGFISRRIPPKFAKLLAPAPAAIPSDSRKSEWRQMLLSYWIRIIVYTVLLVAIVTTSNIYLQPFVSGHVDNATWCSIICAACTLCAMSPFLYGIVTSSKSHRERYHKIWLDSSTGGRWPMVALTVLRLFIAVTFVMAVIFHYFKLSLVLLILIAVIMLLVMVGVRRHGKYGNFLESRFMENLNQKEEHERNVSPISTSIAGKLSGQDIGTTNVTVSPNSKFAGKQLLYLPFRRDFGINVIKIIRGSKIINIPSAYEFIYPADTLVAVGTKSQIAEFQKAMEEDSRTPIPAGETVEVDLESFEITPNSMLCGKSLSMVDMRNSGCMMIGLTRGSESYMNPSPDMVVEEGDIVWIVGDKASREMFK
ncbi:MAG: cation:proton antiporter [Bacteroidales bacterium]|nr:cation:proton antiporter [Bacteroidales bacterium]